MLSPILVFTAIGFAYFLPSDVSLALGLAPIVYCTAVGFFLDYGIVLRGPTSLTLTPETFLHAGAWIAMFLVLIYAGRNHYLSVLRHSLFLGSRDCVLVRETWGGRVFIVAMILFTWQLTRVGVDWQLGLAYSTIAFATWIVLSRVVAETGAFFIQGYYYPCVLILGFLGEKALGPQVTMAMFLVTTVLLAAQVQCLMPYMVHGLKILDLTGERRLGRASSWIGGGLLLCLAVALPVTIYLDYNNGAYLVGYGGWRIPASKMAFDAVASMAQKLNLQGVLASSLSLSGFQRLLHISPNWTCVTAFSTTFVLVLLFSAARMRWSKWPIHPVMFLMLATFQSQYLATSFLIGWALKSVVIRYGGTKGYHRMKLFMIGIIAGEMLSGAVVIVMGIFRYFLKD